MKKLLLALALTGLVAGPAIAQRSTAAGQNVRGSGSIKGTTGASGSAVGQEMHKYSRANHAKGAAR